MVYFRLQGTNAALQAVAANCFGANTYVFFALRSSFLRFYVGGEEEIARVTVQNGQKFSL